MARPKSAVASAGQASDGTSFIVIVYAVPAPTTDIAPPNVELSAVPLIIRSGTLFVEIRMLFVNPVYVGD